MRVIVTRPESEAGPWVAGLQAKGLDVLALPLISIESVADPAPLDKAWTELPAMHAAMFVSGNAVRHFFARRPAAVSWPQAARAWATGNGTREALAAAGVPSSNIDAPTADSPQFDSENLWSVVGPQVRAGDRVLIVRGGESSGEPSGRDWLAERLRAAGASVKSIAAYMRCVPALDKAALQMALAAPAEGVWLFSSSQAIANLVRIAAGSEWHTARAVATHPRIAQSARDAGFGVVCESRPGLDDVIAALESFR